VQLNNRYNETQWDGTLVCHQRDDIVCHCESVKSRFVNPFGCVFIVTDKSRVKVGGRQKVSVLRKKKT